MFDLLIRHDGARAVDLRKLAGLDPRVAQMPVIRLILLEFLLRSAAQSDGASERARAFLEGVSSQASPEILFRPARLVMQDYAGMAALIDLAALRSEAARRGLDPAQITATLPVDLVIDHSLITRRTGDTGSLAANLDTEYRDNLERYRFLKWAEQVIDQLNIVPPGHGIIHQLNMERFSAPVARQRHGSEIWITPDSVLGTDSHTTMINGLGILGWGIGGIEATGVLLGDAIDMVSPRVIGVRLDGALRAGVLAMDIALALTERLRACGVVEAMLEFHGPGVASLSAEDRATLANMCPEYGASAALFPYDAQTEDYFAAQGSDPAALAETGAYLSRNGFTAAQTERAVYDEVIDFDLTAAGRVVAGPFNPAQKTDLINVPQAFARHFPHSGQCPDLAAGDIVLAAITSCTNTANPASMIAAGLLARAAHRAGLTPPANMKCSMVLGSQASARLLARAGLDKDLAALGFHIDGFGCGACVGNAGELSPAVAQALAGSELPVAAVLSGNRNFPGRIHPAVKANYLMSPPLVVAYALAGSILKDLSQEPLGQSPDGQAVYLHDLWPSQAEIDAMLLGSRQLGAVREDRPDDPRWAALPAPRQPVFDWPDASSYLVEPPFLALPSRALCEPVLSEAVPLLLLGDDVTTDHISPVGAIETTSGAAAYLRANGVPDDAFNAYGARRGNHHVMARGTFANPRLENRLVQQKGPVALTAEGGLAQIFEAAQSYTAAGRQICVVAGERYGAGSARDWAAKGTRLLGISAVIAASFERIHRSNLVRMGVLPIEAQIAERVHTAKGEVRISLSLPIEKVTPRAAITLNIRSADGTEYSVPARVRLDTMREVEIYKAGGLLAEISSVNTVA